MMMAAEDLLLQAPEERILFADDWRKELAGVLPTLPAGTLAVFTGRHWLDAGGVWADFAAVAAATGRKVVRFNDIEAEPCTDTVERMVEFLSSVSASAVIAVGGGSVMDAAKAARYWCAKAGCRSVNSSVWIGIPPNIRRRSRRGCSAFPPPPEPVPKRLRIPISWIENSG